MFTVVTLWGFFCSRVRIWGFRILNYIFLFIDGEIEASRGLGFVRRLEVEFIRVCS